MLPGSPPTPSNAGLHGIPLQLPSIGEGSLAVVLDEVQRQESNGYETSVYKQRSPAAVAFSFLRDELSIANTAILACDNGCSAATTRLLLSIVVVLEPDESTTVSSAHLLAAESAICADLSALVEVHGAQ